MNFIESIPLVNAIIKGRFTILANILIITHSSELGQKNKMQSSLYLHGAAIL
jgi:hypothetical protein